MQFSVILSFDFPAVNEQEYDDEIEGEDNSLFKEEVEKSTTEQIPGWIKASMELTEDAPEWGCSEGTCVPHRKYVGILSTEQLDCLVDDCGLYCQETETMGSLGAPVPEGGICLGILPAICYQNEVCYNDQPSIMAYVTPFSRFERKEGWTERDFQRIKKVLLNRHY